MWSSSSNTLGQQSSVHSHGACSVRIPDRRAIFQLYELKVEVCLYMGISMSLELSVKHPNHLPNFGTDLIDIVVPCKVKIDVHPKIFVRGDKFKLQDRELVGLRVSSSLARKGR